MLFSLPYVIDIENLILNLLLSEHDIEHLMNYKLHDMLIAFVFILMFLKRPHHILLSQRKYACMSTLMEIKAAFIL